MDRPTRVVDLDREPYDVYIGRAGKGHDGYFGNPFRLRIPSERREVIEQYRSYFDCRIKTDPEFRRRVLELKGKILGCFCKPALCHGDVIAGWLNAQHEQQERGRPMQKRNVFIANSKDEQPAALARIVEQVKTLLDADPLAGKTSVSITTARDFWEREGKVLGFAGYIEKVATGREYGTGDPLFHVFVIPSARVGRATADLARKAIGDGKRVFVLDGTALKLASRVATVNPKDWQHGWEVR